MTSLFRQDWTKALLSVMDVLESEACFRTYSLWLSDNNQELEEKAMHKVLKRLLKHEPLQYILGEAWFYGMGLRVNKNTLIPRPETEELCELIIKSTTNNSLKILDVGTGSGCIPIALLKNKPCWKATALDIEAGALQIAKENAIQQGILDRVIFIQTDFINDFITSDKWDIIVSNPPYIDSAEQSEMLKNVLEWEPHAALFPEGKDPLIFYKKLAELLKTQSAGCNLWAEINPALAEETLLIFKGFSEKVLIKDMSGKQRFIHAVK